MTLRKGNVTSRVCLSVCPHEVGPHVTTHEHVQTCPLGETPPPFPRPVRTSSLCSTYICRQVGGWA